MPHAPPQAAILAVGGGRERVELVEGAPRAATVMTATLSADNRVYDGELAAKFLAAFSGYMAHPVTMLM
jgi:pyruvate dehydrogenase E2 component (dihydrolipoamide acetyltransferase)